MERAMFAASSVPDLVEAIARRQLAPTDLVRLAMDRIEAANGELNAFSYVARKSALAAARCAEIAVLRGERTGPLHGIPVAIKDAVWVSGMPATYGSRAFETFVPKEDSVVVRRLRDAGAIIVGKTNNPELCYAGTTSNELYGTTVNPRDVTRTAGGSSGGSAAAVAAGMVPIAIGTDAGGSIRIPSSFCGVTGLKPTSGAVADGPGFPTWRSLSVTGPIGRTPADVASVFEVIARHAPEDPRSRPDVVRRRRPNGASEQRIAMSIDLGFAPVDAGVRRCVSEALAALEASGWSLEDEYPRTEDPTSLWTSIAAVEGFAAFGDLVRRQPLTLEARTKALVERGAEVTAADYLSLLEARDALAIPWLQFFRRFDALLTPTLQTVAFDARLWHPETIDGIEVDPELEDWSAFLFQANLLGLPAITVPCGESGGLPVGLQVIAGHGEDRRVIRIADDILARLGAVR